MAYNESIANELRQALAHVPAVEEKKMFGGLAFMVNNKMCVTAGADRIMCRINPDIHEEVITKDGCSTVIMKGREYRGYVYVKDNNLQTSADFIYWVALALEYNKNAKSSNRKHNR